MRVFQVVTTLCVLAGVSQAQHGVDPAYLQQYYQQVAQQAGHRAAAGANQDSTPIFENNAEHQHQQYIAPGQQIRLKDNVQDQVRAQHQQQSPQHTQAYVAPSVREYLQQPQQQLQYVPQQQQLSYKQSVPKAQLLQRRPQEEYQTQGGKLGKEDPEDYDPNPSYQFGFDVKDDEYTNYQNRKEVRDGNVIKGSYSVVDSDGFIRTVKYTADPKEGFKAEVIREPTDIVVKIPTPPPQQLLRHQEPAGPQYLSHGHGKSHQQYYQQQ